MRAAADVLRDAGDVVVIWGERLRPASAAARPLDALLALADALGVAGQAESGLIGCPPSTNGRGLREVGCLPSLAPGLADAPPPETPPSSPTQASPARCCSWSTTCAAEPRSSAAAP